MAETRINFEFNLTYRCNAACDYCNRLVDVYRIPDSDLTIAQVKHALAELKAANIYIKKLKFSGGEASLNKNVVEICELCVESGIVGTVWVLSNGLIKDLPKLPTEAKWRVDPILDPKEGYKNHQPFLISPDDLGIRSENCGVSCSTQKHCGRAFEGFGFTFCGVAGALGHLLDINVYSEKPVLSPDERICKHCIYSLPDAQQKELQRMAPLARWPDGSKTHGDEIEYPTKTFKEAFEKNRKPYFPRAFERESGEIKQAKRLASAVESPPSTVIQAGVGNTAEARFLAGQWPEATFVGVDPHPKVDAKTYPGKIIRKALMDKVATVTFYRRRNWQRSSIFSHEARHQIPKTVDATTIDELVEQEHLSGPFVLWLDCEGAELFALLGAKHTLSMVSCLNIELAGNYERNGAPERQVTEQALADWGFVCVSSHRRDAIYRRSAHVSNGNLLTPIRQEEEVETQ